MSDEPGENEEENMQCENQSPQDPVQVFCRLRAIPDETELTNIKLISPTTLTLITESKVIRKECNYVFRHIFTSYSGQREVFEHVTLPLLEDLIQGKNGLLFTYGVTGSGKTYTLSGDQSSPGIMPRSIDTIFNSIGEQQTPKYLIKTDRMNGFELQSENDAQGDRLIDSKSSNKRLKNGKSRIFYVNDGTKLNCVNSNSLYTVFISYVEIYNNTIYDLLDESTGKVLQAKIIREDWQKNMYVNGVIETEVKSSAEAFELFFLGQKRKRMAQTTLNTESSRSHSVFNIRVVQLEKDNLLKVGQLSLVDLAGSERCSRAQTTGLRLKEASSINNSLMSLRTCLQILRDNQLNDGNKLVPYRDSRLTLLFKSYFEGEGQVRMIVCVNPSDKDCEENLQVLKFAEMTQDVKVPRAESRYAPYRKTPKTPKTQNTPIVKCKKVIFNNGFPKLPNLILSMEDPDHNVVILENLEKFLTVYKEKTSTNKYEIRKKEDHFRKRLMQIHQDNVLSTCEIRSLKAMLRKTKETNGKLEGKLTDLEVANEALSQNNEQLQDVIRTLQNTVDEKNLKLNQNQLQREKNKQKQALQTQKMSEELEEKLRKQRQILNAAVNAKDAKIRKVKEILDSDTISITSQTQHLPDLRTQLPERQQENIETTINQSVSVLRPHRGRGIGEVWLEHNAIKPVPLDTVMQPTMKKRKSVSKLKKAADITNPKQNRYCLIAQEPDHEGDTETKVYKADIVRTCGGGAQVIFNDVECLRQESPTREKPMTPIRN